MQNNKLRMAIRSTAALAALGIASQAQAVELSTGDYETSLYGFARIAATYDIDEDIASGGQSGNFSSITTGDADTSDGHFGIDANTSRLGVSVKTPEDVKVVVELDFDGSDGLDPRLRHAYGEYNNVLIGRYWSNYNSFAGFIPGLDFDSLPGLAGTQGRTEQIRYTSGALSFSLEEPLNYTGVVFGVDADGDPDTSNTKSATPALTAKLADSQGGMSYAAGVMVKQTSMDTGSADESALGYAAFVAGNIAVTDAITLYANLNYGDGASAYVYRAGGNFGQFDGYIDPTSNDLETIEAVGGAAGASFALGGGRSVNAGYGTASVDLDDAVEDTTAIGEGVTDTNSMAFINYMWKPVTNVKMGVEYAYLETETQGGDDGDASRVMFLTQYSF